MTMNNQLQQIDFLTELFFDILKEIHDRYNQHIHREKQFPDHMTTYTYGE